MVWVCPFILVGSTKNTQFKVDIEGKQGKSYNVNDLVLICLVNKKHKQ